MNSETWLDKAARLQRAVRRNGPAEDEVSAARERIEMALWLKHEFSDEQRDAANVLPFAVGAQD